MSFAYFPLYTGDYLRDTRHLSPLRHGVYLMLLMHCWDTKGPLPVDEQEIAGLANCRSSDEVEALRYVISRFFTQMADGYYNQRVQREVEKAEAISRERSQAGRKGYEARAKHLPSKSQATASNPTPIPSPAPTPSKSTTLSSSPKTAANLDAESLLQFLNQRTSREFRPTAVNLDMIRARIKEGYTPREIRAVIARKCREWKDDDKMSQYLRPMTLFNRTKFAQYVGEVPIAKESDDVSKLP